MIEKIKCKTQGCTGTVADLHIAQKTATPGVGVDHVAVECAKCRSRQSFHGKEAETLDKEFRERDKKAPVQSQAPPAKESVQ